MSNPPPNGPGETWPSAGNPYGDGHPGAYSAGNPYPQQPPPPPPQWGGYGYGPPQKHSGAVVALVLGIVGLVVCQIASPFALWYGKKTMNEIEASHPQLTGMGEAKAGWICGIIGTVLLALTVVVFVVLILIGVFAASTAPEHSSTFLLG